MGAVRKTNRGELGCLKVGAPRDGLNAQTLQIPSLGSESHANTQRNKAFAVGFGHCDNAAHG